MKKHDSKKSEPHLRHHKLPKIYRFITDSFTIFLFKTRGHFETAQKRHSGKPKEHPESPDTKRDSGQARMTGFEIGYKSFKLKRAIKVVILTLLGAAMFLLLGISGSDLYSNYQSKKKIDLERQKIISKIEKWQGIVKKYKDYRDGYFQLSILEYRLRNFAKSKVYLDKALALDPNFEKGRAMEKILNR